MLEMMMLPHLVAFLFSAAILLPHLISAAASIGVNYGTNGDNLPPPAQVAQFIQQNTIIDRIRIFDANPDVLRAFANTGILVSVTIPNGDIPALADLRFARRWVSNNIKPFYPQTKINYICVGTEVLHWGPQNLIDGLVSAMRSLSRALEREGVSGVKVTSPHSLSILLRSQPPSRASFRPGWDVGVLAPMLRFLRETKSVFMVNPYPYFGFDPNNLDFSIFRPNRGYVDPVTKLSYTNMFDVLLDAVYTSMKRLGYGDVPIVAGETGWASAGELPQATVPIAASYNAGLIKKVNSGVGTPMMPGKKIETYIFSLFNENLKGPYITEKNFGLFQPDFTTVYNAGVLKAGSRPGQPQPGKQWCVPKTTADDQVLQNNLNWVCTQGAYCKPIEAGGPCYNPPTVRSHASFVMNAYFQANGRAAHACDFAGSGITTDRNPSYGGCVYNA